MDVKKISENKSQFLTVLKTIGSYKQELMEDCGIELENDERISLKEFFGALGFEFKNIEFEKESETEENIFLTIKTTIKEPNDEE